MSAQIALPNLPAGLESVSSETLAALIADRQYRRADSDGIDTDGGFRFDAHWDYQPASLPGLYARNDERSGVFFSRQLKSMIPQMFEVEHGLISARSVFPLARDGGPGTETITYALEEDIGEAKLIADYSTDIPCVNTKGEEFDTKVKSLAVCAKWSVQEIRAAAMAGKNLRGSLARAARKAMLRTENRLAWFGDANAGIRGFFSAGTGIPSSAAGAAWSGATPAQILADLHACANAPVEATLGNWRANKVYLPLTELNRIATTNSGLSTDATILRTFVQNSPYISSASDVVGLQELEDIDGLGTKAMVCGAIDPDVLRMETPLDLEQFAPQEHCLVTSVIWHMRVAGLIVTRPLALNVLTGL